MLEKIITVSSVIGYNIAVSSSDGNILYKKIVEELRKDDVSVVVDFKNISVVSASFLLSGIVQLYAEFPDHFLASKLSIKNLQKDDKEILNRLIDRVKAYS